MKIFLFLLILTSCSTADPDRARRLKFAEFSYSSGCYEASIYICGKYLRAPEKFSCYEDMDKTCPGAANIFRIWLENGKK